MRRGVLILALLGPISVAVLLMAETPATRVSTASIDEAIEARREAARRRRLTLDPEDLTAWNEVRAMAARRPLPRDSVAFRDARASLPSRFVETETTRYIILADADPVWTAQMAGHLEQTHHQFDRFCGRLDARPLPLRHKLVCILFEDRSDYRRFATTHDGVAADWIAGYYAPRHDRIVFYNVQSNPSVAEARARLDRLSQRATRIDRSARDALRDGRSHEAAALQEGVLAYRRHIVDERERVTAFTTRVNTATTVHEAVHQLLFHTGVQSPSVRYPLWLSEGLATAFETDAPGEAFGPDRHFAPRAERIQELIETDRLLPLGELIAMTGLPDDPSATIDVVYHQSYDLVSWLHRHRRDGLRRCLMAYRRAEHEAADPDHAAIFARSFGDVDTLERSWRRLR